MYNIALEIRAKDWFYILLIGLFFGMFLSALGYTLLEFKLFDGALFGALLGFSITLLSLFFISFMNKNILPKLPEVSWLPLSMLFSFLSGFLGTHLGMMEAEFLSLQIIPIFEKELFFISIIIGVLTYIVGALLYRFVKMRNQKDYLDKEFIESRLRSLETQLNPHFLFNALNSIAELIHHDKDKAEVAILKVSSFLRNTMNEQALISLKDEIQNVKGYLELENIRFSDKIHLTIEGEVPSWCLPKFSIQLLAENAIKHGYNHQKKSLELHLSFDKEKKVVILSNNGLPMKSKKFGIGLSNLKQRLELLCQGNLEIVDATNPTFHIHIGVCHENTCCR